MRATKAVKWSLKANPAQMFEAGTLTSDYLKGKKTIAPRLPRRKGNGKQLMLKGCTGHNLRDVDLTLNLELPDLLVQRS